LTDAENPTSGVTPFGIVKLILVLFVGLTALFVVLAVLGLFAWLALWSLLLKLGAVAGVITLAVLLISWLIQKRTG
jgi:hypothetical protein